MKTIEELIDALESGTYAKCEGQFKTNRPPALAYCCLGVYATINNMNFPSTQVIFGWSGTDCPVSTTTARLPEGHFLIEKIHLPETAFRAGGYDVQLQSYLTDLNDDSETFEPVIRALKAYAGGQRAFPPAPTFIEAVEE